MKIGFVIALTLLSIGVLTAAIAAGGNHKSISIYIKRVLLAALLPMVGTLEMTLTGNECVAQVSCLVSLIGTDIMSVLLLYFMQHYCRMSRDHWFIRGIIYLCTIADCTQMLLNPITHHVFHLESAYSARFGEFFCMIPGSGFYAHLAVSGLYILLLLSIIIYRILQTPWMYAEQYYVVLAALLLTILWQGLCVMDPWEIDTSMLGYGACGLLLFYFALYYRPIFLLWHMMHGIVSELGNGIAFFNMDQHCIYVNKKAGELIHVADEKELDRKKNELQRQFEFEDETFEREFERNVVIREPDRRYYHVEFHIMRDSHDRKVGGFFSVKDRTEEETANRKELYRASHDSLTGLYNLDYFCRVVQKCLEAELERAGGKEEAVAGRFQIVVTDIRNFKMVNELYGKSRGDEILQKMVHGLKAITRKDSIVGRVSGDRFAVFCRCDGFPENELKEFLHGMDSVTNNRAFPVLSYAGIYVIHQPMQPVNVMIDHAAMACNTIKGEYSTRIVRYHDALRDSMLWEQKVTGEIEHAIEDGEIVPYLQAQVNREEVMEGAEVLVRWRSREEGVISPGRFIPILEKNGQIALVDLYMWESACRILSQWKKEGRDQLYLSINISPKDFYFMDVYETLTGLVERYGIAAANLRLEITETVMMDDPEKRLPLLESLRSYGFIVEMDDFGSGYSSLNMLKDIPVDVLKIDMGFLYETRNPDRARNILDLIIQLSRRLGIRSVIEGVETGEQARLLRQMGCDMFQGYYYSKPIPEEEFRVKYLY